jgi:hypothetical protein
VKQVGLVGGDRLLFGSGLGLIEGPASVRGDGDESAVGAAGGARSALDAQAARRRERADRERRLEALAVAVLTALGERDRAVKDAEMRAGEALRAMSVDEGLSVREAVEWCGTGITVREVSRLRRLAGDPSAS